MDNRPTAALIVADAAGGGQASAVLQHASWLTAAGHSVVTAGPGRGFTRHIPIPTRASAWRQMLLAVRALSRVYRDAGSPRVYVHGFRAALVALLATRRRVVWIQHGFGALAVDSRRRRSVRRIVTAASALVANGRYSVAPDPPHGWRFLPWPSPNLISLARPGFETVGSTRPEVLWLGALQFPKRPDVLLDALKAVRQPVTVVLAGVGPNAEALQAQAAELPARHEVRWLGQATPGPSLSSASVVCLFSDFEGVPFSLQEALAAGCAILATPLPGIRWLCGSAAAYATSGETAAAQLEMVLSDIAGWRAKSAARWTEIEGVFSGTPAMLVSDLHSG